MTNLSADTPNSLQLQIEDSLVGCLLLEPSQTIDAIRGLINESDFSLQAARSIYKATKELVYSKAPADPNLILKKAEEMGEPVGTQYCQEAMLLTPSTVNAPEYAKAIHEAAVKRRGQEIAWSLVNDEITMPTAIADLQDLMQNQQTKLQTPMEAASEFADYINAVASGKKRQFVSSGFHKLDEILSGGLVEGGLITIAARPGTGKSTAAITIAEHVAATEGTILYVSLEMTSTQIWSCRVSAYSGLNRSSVYTVAFDKEDTKSWTSLTGGISDLSNRPFYIRDKPSSIEDIEQAARGLKDLKLLVIDHIGLIKNTGKAGSRYEVMTETSHRLKQLALAMHIPILALCQLNRSSTQRENKRPTMSDLRDSGAIEEDSDVVILLHRDAQFLPEEEKPKPFENQEILFIVDKNRHGITSTLGLAYCGANSRIMGGY